MGLTNKSTGSKILSFKDKKNSHVDYEVALAGNPNVGKSTLFNELTGMNQHTGNWPGKTVESAVGYYEYKDKKIKMVDLPGTYSLLSNSEEEEIARNYICLGDANVIVVVADATSLERNLNLFFQVYEIADNVVLCINLIDEASKRGIEIDLNKLENEINAPVVFVSAREKIGIEQLKSKIEKYSKRICKKEKNIIYEDSIEKCIKKIEYELKGKIKKNENDHKIRWIALRLLENNKKLTESISKVFGINHEVLKKIKSIVKNELGYIDINDKLAKSIITKSEEVYKSVVINNGKSLKLQKSMDKIAVSRITGIPLMILTLIIVLWITITLANYPSQILTLFFSKIREYFICFVEYFQFPLWFSSMLIDGVFTTLSWVVSVMLPPMAIFFPLFTLLEDFGYLPRIAFNLDKCFKKCCSCGKQALTMCMGLGCNAAGVVGCRIINSPREKLIAILTNVFMPCNGRFPILISISTIFIAANFTQSSVAGGILSAIVVSIIIIIGVMMTLIVSRILSKTILKGIPSNFILELPPYRKPQIKKVIVRSLFDRTIYVLGRAISVAAPAGIIIWIFANIFVGDNSLLTICANFLEPFAHLIGLDGYILMAFLLGFPANEIVMPLIIMSYLKKNTMVEMNNLEELRQLLINNGWTLLTAVNIMIFSLIHYPCATTLVTIKKETNSFKWTLASFLIPTIIGIIVCFIVTQIWRAVV